MAVNRCLDTRKDGEVDFKNYKSILAGLLNLFKIPSTASQTMPAPLILAKKGMGCSLKPSVVASRIIQRQSEAGLPVGALPSGKTSPAEIMERIRVEEMIKVITQAKVDVAIQPGTAIQGTGGNAGGPVQVAGTIVGIAQGQGSIC